MGVQGFDVSACLPHLRTELTLKPLPDGHQLQFLAAGYSLLIVIVSHRVRHHAAVVSTEAAHLCAKPVITAQPTRSRFHLWQKLLVFSISHENNANHMKLYTDLDLP